MIEKYDQTAHVPEALHRLTESYLSLGVVDEAQRNAAVLGYNFPSSNWYEDSYTLLTEGHHAVATTEPAQDDGTVLDRTWDWMF